MSTCDKCGQYISPTQEQLDASARRSLTDEEYATYCRLRDETSARMRKARADVLACTCGVGAHLQAKHHANSCRWSGPIGQWTATE